MNKKVFFLKFDDYKNYKNYKNKNIFLDGEIYVPSLTGKGYITDYKYGDLDELMGEYAYIQINKDGNLEIGTDFYGFYSLFWMRYSLDNKEGLLISNCFHSLASYASKDSDISILLPNILAKDIIFLQAYTTETPVKSIKRLGWDQCIEINESGFNVVKRAWEISNLGYHNLLSLGIKSVQESLKKIDKRQSLNLYLSGGKDSRAILALALSAGLTPFCSTHSPEKYTGEAKKMVTKDFEIACFLVDRYQLQWYEPPNKLAIPIDFNESLERYLFYRSGRYLFSPNHYIVYSTEWGEEVQLRGAVGEVFKSEDSWGEYIKRGFIGRKLKGVASSFKEDVILFFNMLTKPYGLTNASYNLSCNHVYSSLKDLRKSETDTIYDALERHYLAYRNHFHFGHMRATQAEGKSVFYPLANKYFYFANQQLSREDQKSGRLIFDIIENCFSELNNYSYDSGYHQLLSTNRQQKMTSYFVSEKKYHQVALKNLERMKGLFTEGASFNAEEKQRTFIDETLSWVYDNEYAFLKDYKQFDSYITALKDNRRTLGKITSILGSISCETTAFCANSHQLIVVI